MPMQYGILVCSNNRLSQPSPLVSVLVFVLYCYLSGELHTVDSQIKKVIYLAMDAFVIMNPYLFALLILPISIIFVFFISRKPKNGCSNITFPPGSRGWPLVGESIWYALLGPQKFVDERMKKYSPKVFETNLFGEKMAVFCGAEGNKILFTNENKLVRSWWPMFVKRPLYYPDFTDEVASVDEITAVLLSSLHSILKPEVLKEYISTMDFMAREQVESDWASREVVNTRVLLRKYTFDLSCKLFMNIVDSEHLTKLAKHFGSVANGIYSVPLDLPGTAYNRAIKDGKLLREELMKIITEKRDAMLLKNYSTNENSVAGQDFLSRLLLVTDENGNFMRPKEICNNIVGLLLASYESTSTSATSVFKYLAELPHIYNEVYREQMEIAKSKKEKELLNWEDIQKMKYSWNVVCESLRLDSDRKGAFREAITDFDFAGFTIQKGTKTHWTACTTHKNPEYFPDPEKFDPSRFEGNRIAPYTFVPFGGGRRMCPGKEYARFEILVFIHNIVTNFRLEKVTPKKILYVYPSPETGVLLRLIPHKK
ncbi:beta-amyrin 6-beta-monooxygenase-like [Apium graveolens]|uniref:beta-amyrin 6-beta-monooxygenase-like n=1 Tax=Apium graveolens TaxID=4045 RepID=UPI003D7AE517